MASNQITVKFGYDNEVRRTFEAGTTVKQVIDATAAALGANPANVQAVIDGAVIRNPESTVVDAGDVVVLETKSGSKGA